MAKIYERINWENLPSKNTPINAENLNKMDEAIDKLDDKIVELEEGSSSGGGGDGSCTLPVATSTVLGGVYVDEELKSDSVNPVQNGVVASEINGIKDDLTEVFQSVSNGKELIASAITDKSIVTPSDATFQIMAENISYINTVEHKHIQVREIGSIYFNKYDNIASNVSEFLTIDGSNSWYYRGILQHDISMIPTESTVVCAKLKMYAFSGNDNYKLSRCFVTRVTSTLDDATSWTTQPTYEFEEYADHKQTPNVDVASGVPMWCEVDITNIVKQWVENNEPNYGVLIRAIEEGEYRYNWDICTRLYNDGEYASYIDVGYI